MFGLFRKKETTVTLSVVELAGAGYCAVAGESHYQEALNATRGVCSGTHEGHPAFTAVLVPEPHNPYDANAIAVWSPRGKLGYLPRDDADDYGELFDEIMRRGYDGGTCQAFLTGGEPGKPSYGVVLRLADAETCLDELDEDPPDPRDATT